MPQVIIIQVYSKKLIHSRTLLLIAWTNIFQYKLLIACTNIFEYIDNKYFFYFHIFTFIFMFPVSLIDRSVIPFILHPFNIHVGTCQTLTVTKYQQDYINNSPHGAHMHLKRSYCTFILEIQEK